MIQSFEPSLAADATHIYCVVHTTWRGEQTATGEISIFISPWTREVCIEKSTKPYNQFAPLIIAGKMTIMSKPTFNQEGFC